MILIVSIIKIKEKTINTFLLILLLIFVLICYSVVLGIPITYYNQYILSVNYQFNVLYKTTEI